MAANPRPTQHNEGARFVGPTGARTESKISSASAIFVGAVHHLRTLGKRSVNSAFPWKKGRPSPFSLYSEDGGDCPIIMVQKSSSLQLVHPLGNSFSSLTQPTSHSIVVISLAAPHRRADTPCPSHHIVKMVPLLDRPVRWSATTPRCRGSVQAIGVALV